MDLWIYSGDTVNVKTRVSMAKARRSYRSSMASFWISKQGMMIDAYNVT